MTNQVTSTAVSEPHASDQLSYQQGWLSDEQTQQLYSLIKTAIHDEQATHLKECNCMEAFYRDLNQAPDKTSRYIFDQKVGEHAAIVSGQSGQVSILALGSGLLLNELTAFTNVLAQGINLDIYLLDCAYVFHQEEDYKKVAVDYAEHPERIPVGWQDFYFWAWYKNGERPFLPFFEAHHNAIAEFKRVMQRINQTYGTTTTISVMPPAAVEPVDLPQVDMVISPDSFLDIPNLTWNLFYVVRLRQSDVRYLALNKAKPMGKFWEAEDEEGKPVTVDIYDLNIAADSGQYRLVEKISFTPDEMQTKNYQAVKPACKHDKTQSLFHRKGQPYLK